VKKEYKKPGFELTEFRFTEHIAASGGGGCYWGDTIKRTHGYPYCKDNETIVGEGWIDLNS
jgi:hypothetical protein